MFLRMVRVSTNTEVEIDGDDVVPLLVLHAHEQIVVGDAGIVDENIDLAERLLGLLAELDHRRPVAQIARQREHAAPSSAARASSFSALVPEIATLAP